MFKNFLEVNRDSLSISDNKMCVAIIKHTNNFEETTTNLPNPDSMRVDNSHVAERASYNFTYNSSQTSYQGEYPLR